MKRLTQKDENGFYLTGDGIYSDWGVPEKFRGEDIDRLADIEDILGDEYELDWLRELVEADREGRCVVLPCKVGDVVYEIRYTAENIKPSKHAKKKFDHSVSGCTWRMRARPDMCYVSEKKCTKSDFSFMGRTVFLTRAEAEDALKAREQND